MTTQSSPQGPLIPSDLNTASLLVSKPKVTKGTVTVATAATDGTLNASAGVITITSATTASTEAQSLTLTNSACSADSVVVATIVSYGGTVGTDGFPSIQVTPGDGSFVLTTVNESVTAAALSGALVVSFVIV